MNGRRGRLRAKLLLLILTLFILALTGYGVWRWVSRAVFSSPIPPQQEFIPPIATAPLSNPGLIAPQQTPQGNFAGSLRPVTLTADYLWQQDGPDSEMVLYTPPTYEALESGALLATDIVPVWTNEDRDGDGQTDVPELHTCVATTLIPLYLLPGDTVVLPTIQGFSVSYFVVQLDTAACRYRCERATAWQDLSSATLQAEGPCWIILNFAWANLQTTAPGDIDTTRPLTTEDAKALARTISLYRTHTDEDYRLPYFSASRLAEEVSITRGCTEDGALYLLTRIPAKLADGTTVLPQVDTTNSILDDAYIDQMELKNYHDPRLIRAALPTQLYAMVYHTGLTVNAGLFLQENLSPLGLTVSDGTVITNLATDGESAGTATEYYALTVDTLGRLGFAQQENGLPDCGYSAFRLTDAGRQNVVTGWGCLILNGRVVVTTDEDNADSTMLFYDYLDTRHSRQVIAQDRDGNYLLLSTAEDVSGTGYGLTYEEAAEILLRNGAVFAYALDGGLSVSTVRCGELCTPLYMGIYGRPVATVLNFHLN